MKRTKIICTIGPSSESAEMLEKLAKAGMDICRLNFSHGGHEDHLKRIKRIKELNPKLYVPLSIMLDTQGPEIRLGQFKEKTMLQDGAEVILTPRDVISDAGTISISYKKLPYSVTKGNFIYIADGTIELKVKDISGPDVICTVVVGGEVDTRKNVDIPEGIIDLPSISEKDEEDILFGAKHEVDFVAQSFVKSSHDVLNMKALLRKYNSDASVIAKIECDQALHDIDNIINVSDGIMVARGDLGVQIPIEEVPNAQKMIIRKCNEAGKPVIVATQMLESMTKNSRPTRAEVTDVANAILDGSDAVMLSGETAAGKYPLKSVEIMRKICEQTEAKMEWQGLRKVARPVNVDDAISRSVCQTAHDINAAAIVTFTMTGRTARLISKYRPLARIIAVTPNESEIRKINLFWGVRPMLIPEPKNTDDLIKTAMDEISKIRLVKKSDVVVLTGSIPFNTPGNLNLMKVHVVE